MKNFYSFLGGVLFFVGGIFLAYSLCRGFFDGQTAMLAVSFISAIAMATGAYLQSK